ncbi:MAG: PEP-CTERM sorting domain-containing protein [Armatimonadetes bacterium]|nr:PEP-CTERM sorting domain-containing protein [Armatimonadota bacterium]
MKRLALLSGVAALFGLAAVNASADTILVHIFNFDFSLNPLGEPIEDPIISVGDTIRWILDEGRHTVTSVMGIPEVFDSGDMQKIGETFEHTFTNVGTWWYYCDFHGFDNGDGTASGMAGTVTVGVPEPSTFAALAVGGLLLLKRRKK